MNEKELEELEKNAFHVVPLDVLKKYCDPLGCWHDIDKPITKKEVLEALKIGNVELTDTSFVFSKEIDLKKARENHIKKIAYFVENEPKEPLQLDVGLPDMGCYVDYILQDGNHRFAGSIIKQREFINCSISGSENYIKELGLWFPNDNLKKLFNHYKEKSSIKSKKNKI